MVPDIGAVTAVLAKLHIVEMRCLAMFENVNRLVLATIQAAHPAAHFIPTHEIQ